MPKSPFVKLKTGEVILGSHVEMKDRYIVSSTVTIDNKTFKSREVEFYGDGSGILYGRLTSLLTESVYSNSEKGIYFFKSSGGALNAQGDYSSRTVYGYTIGITGIQSINFNNVSRDMSNDPVALDYINKAKSERTRERISLAVTGVGLGMFFLGELNAHTSTGSTLWKSGCVITFGGAISTIVFSLKKRKNTREAVTAYSGFVFSKP